MKWKLGYWIQVLLTLCMSKILQAQTLPLETASSPLDKDRFEYQCEQKKIDHLTLNYCIYWTKNNPNRNKDILYIFHPFGKDETIFHTHPEIAKVANVMGDQSPTVVSVSYRLPAAEKITYKLFKKILPFWFMSFPSHKKSLSGMYTHFTSAAIPYLEHRVSVLVDPLIGKRMLMGISMGGFNALTYYVNGSKLFSKYLALCPSLLSFLSHDPPRAVRQFLNQSTNFGIDVKGEFVWAIYLANRTLFFENSQHFARTSPFHSVQRMARDSPPLFLTFNSKDQYGYLPPNLQFTKKLSQLDIQNTKVYELPGQHCSHFDQITHELAEFILK